MKCHNVDLYNPLYAFARIRIDLLVAPFQSRKKMAIDLGK
jgi:hypothetical protein